MCLYQVHDHTIQVLSNKKMNFVIACRCLKINNNINNVATSEANWRTLITSSSLAK